MRQKLRISALAAIVSLVLATVLGLGGVANAATSHGKDPHTKTSTSGGVGHASPRDENSWSELQVQYYPKAPCLDADTNGGGLDRNKVQLWKCNQQYNQEWSFQANSYTVYGYFQLMNRGWVAAGRHLCLDADASSTITNGTKVQLWTCNGQQNQSWYCANVGSQTCFSDLRLQTAGIVNGNLTVMCLDADLYTVANDGGRAQVWACNGNANQEWQQIDVYN